MLNIQKIIAILFLLNSHLYLFANGQQKKQQATPPPTKHFGTEAFLSTNQTEIRWLGNAGFFINSHGTCVMVDPLLTGFDMPLLIEVPIQPEEIPHLNAVLITHNDNDHYSLPTCQAMQAICPEFHSTRYAASLIKAAGLLGIGHEIGDEFRIGNLQIRLTPADHTWPNHFPGQDRIFQQEDYCGFWIETPEGVIWATGDSRLMPEHLDMPAPDAIFFDFSDSPWHFGLEGAVKLANAYPDTPLLLCHWGTVDAPDMKEFNGDPEELKERVVNPERIYVLAPGEPFILNRIIPPKKNKMNASLPTENKVRLSRITVDPAQLDLYNTYLKEEIEASMRLEPGVVILYAVAEKEHSNQITILEIYTDEAAYQKHIQTPHFLKYKQETLPMVQHLELIDTTPLIPDMFGKFGITPQGFHQ